MNTSLRSTRHDLPEAGRRAMIILLNRQLADLLDLGLQAKQAHWNVRGPEFAALHEFFDELATEVATLADDVAERAVALGGAAEGTVQAVAAATRLEPYPADAATGTDHVRLLAAGFARAAATARAAIDTATAGGDAATADVFTQVVRALDKTLWQLDAHAAG